METSHRDETNKDGMVNNTVGEEVMGEIVHVSSISVNKVRKDLVFEPESISSYTFMDPMRLLHSDLAESKVETIQINAQVVKETELGNINEEMRGEEEAT